MFRNLSSGTPFNMQSLVSLISEIPFLEWQNFCIVLEMQPLCLLTNLNQWNYVTERIAHINHFWDEPTSVIENKDKIKI